MDSGPVKEKSLRNWRGGARRSLTGVLVVMVVGLIGAGVVVRTGHLSLAPVLSGSMQPAVNTGDLALLWQVPTSALKVGDVVSFYPPGDTTNPKMHRIVALSRTGGKTTITTKGDANPITDPWGTATLRGATAYRMVGVVPLVGWTASIERRWIYLLLIVAGVLMGIATIRDFRRSSGSKPPQAAAEDGGGSPPSGIPAAAGQVGIGDRTGALKRRGPVSAQPQTAVGRSTPSGRRPPAGRVVVGSRRGALGTPVGKQPQAAPGHSTASGGQSAAARVVVGNRGGALKRRRPVSKQPQAAAPEGGGV